MTLREQDKEQFVENARKVYDERLKDRLEKDHFGKVIGLEPQSGEYDTGFAGTLVVGEELFDSAHATPAGYAEADLASQQRYVYPCFFVEFPWHGETVRVQVLIGPGTECLLGAELLNPHRLEIDYGKRTVHVVPNPSW